MSSGPRRVVACAVLSGMLALSLLGVVSSGASVEAGGKVVSARLTKTSFTAAQAKTVKLVCKFSPASKRFGYLLSQKKGAKWVKVRSVNKTGSFKGSYTMTVKKLFGSKAVKVGQYRVKVSADANNVTRSFKVVKATSGGSTPTGSKPASTALPIISGTTTQGQTLSSSNGSWSNSPTSYTRQWRRCDSSGASCADISGASSSSYTLASADVNSTIRVVVTATNANGSASATSGQTAAVAGLLPGAFNKASPANGAIGLPISPSPSLSWGASSNATSYEVCIDKTNNNACDGSWASMGAETSASTTGLTLGTTYYWQVHAINTQGTTDADGGSWFSLTVTGPLAGRWTATNGVYFYVMPDQANVIHVDFSYQIDNGLCSGQHEEAWTTTPKPIVSGYFSTYGSATGWSGTGGGADFSGTFDSPTSAHGTAQLEGQCFALGVSMPWENPPFSWTATWQDASQPS